MFKRALLIIGLVVAVWALAGLAAGCGSGDKAEEFKTYWNAMGKVSTKQGAAYDKARDKADRAQGAFNRLAVFYEAMSGVYGRTASGWGAVEPPSSLSKEHKALVKEYRSSAAALKKLAARIKGADWTKFTDKDWQDSVTTPGGRAMKRVSAAFGRWVAAAKAEGGRLGVEFAGD